MVGYTENVWALMKPIFYPYDLGWKVPVGRGMCPPLVQTQTGQCGNIHLHANDMLLWQEGQQHLIGCAVRFIKDMNGHHVVLVRRHSQVDNAWSPAGAHMVAMPLEDIVNPLAYTLLRHNLVIALPLAWT
jgi:hypothetical protein